VSKPVRTVLFICTGNHYRSRFAEAVFNHHARTLKLDWQAISRGLSTYLLPDHFSLSSHTAHALRERGIDLRLTAEEGRQLDEDDLRDADCRIALHETEHRPMLRKRFPQWENKVTYWSVQDEHELSPLQALPQIERMVLKILEECWLRDQPNRNTHGKT
jgi:protein-tyrosine phosphatase